MATLRDQSPIRRQLLNDYLKGNTTLGNDLEQKDELVDGGASSSSSNDSDVRPSIHDDNEMYSYLEPLETFITKSCAFASFKINLGYLLRPPTNLSEALKSRELRVVQRFLSKNFGSAATSDFTWLQELDEAGYSVREIAELLLEDIKDSPWIHFSPQMHPKSPIRIDFHISDCAHQISLSTKPASILHPE